MSAPMHTRSSRNRSQTLAIAVGFQLILLAVWELASRSGEFPTYLHGPLAIVAGAAKSLVDADVLARAGQSLYRVYAGFLIGSAIGVVLGLLSGVFRPARDLFDVIQAFVHAIPKISLFPAVAIWLGFTDASRILIISLSCFFPAYLNAMNGAMGINPRYLWLARNNEIGSVRTFFHVVLPAALPRTLVGLRISLMVAFILMVATEVIGHSDGLGSMVMLAYQDGDYQRMYSAILLIAIAGYASNFALQRLTTYLCRGHDLEIRASA